MSEKQPNKTDKQSLQNVPFDCLEMLMNAPIGIFTSTPDGRFIDVNPAMARMFGFDSPQEMMNSIENIAVQLYADPEDRDEIQNFLEQDDERLNYECRFIRKDGSLFWASNNVRAVKDETGNVVYYQSFFSDITEHKRMEEALCESETKYRTLIETSRDLIYTTDDKGFMTYANPSLEKILGYETGELSGRLFTKIVAPEYIDTVRKYFSRAMKGETIPVYEAELVRKDGTKISVEFNAITLFDSNGKPSGRYGIGRDITERKKEEEERRGYESRLASIIDFLPDATLAIDREGRVIAWNRAIEDMTGVPEAAMLGKGAHEYAIPFYGKRRPLLIDFVFTWSAELEKEYSFINKDGDTLYTETAVPFVRGENRVLWAKASPLYDAGGNVIGAIESIRDMTERKRSEEALRLSEERYRTILEEMEDGYQEVDILGNFTFFNESFRRIFGYPREELLGSNFRRYAADEENANRVYEAYNEMFLTGNPIKRFEWDIITKGGMRRTVEFSASLLRDSGGHRRGFRGVVRDVTDRRVAEEQYRTIANSSPGGVYIIQDGLMCFVNPQIPTYSGYAEEELIGSRILNYVYPEDRKSVKENARSMLRGEISSPYEFRIIDKQGNVKWLMERVVPICYRGRQAVLGNNMDITEQKVAEEEKGRLREQLIKAQKMEAIGTLAGGLAHDFNNLLMGIQGQASLMMLELDSSDPHYKRLKHIEDQVKSGAGLTKQLLGFARGGRYELKPTDMSDVLEKTAFMFGRTKKEITFHKKYIEDLWAVQADRTQMGQVFMNLFVNAWQAMPMGGEIFLETENVFLDEGKALSIGLSSGKYVRITVSDTGTGMDAKTLERIFDPFFTTKGMGRGTGLGLAMVYGILKGHGGTIHASSELGHGATFEIYVPATEKAVVGERDAQMEVLRGTETVLLVDDEAMVLDVTRSMLQSLGYRVYCAGSGQEALSVFYTKRGEIDLVILDMIMPGISGSETFNRLREIDPKQKVLLSTGYSIDGEAKELLEKGCNGFLQKPFKMEDIAREVRALLDKGEKR